jgi:glycosyltransferase involved in cell wall biosynthesis
MEKPSREISSLLHSKRRLDSGAADQGSEGAGEEGMKEIRMPPARECIAKDGLPVSVVICTYNRAELLRMTLDSLAGQTLGRDKYEIIVIDDGSSDGTRQCVESFADRLPIKYFFQKNAGLASAKNHGIFAARGEILFFMDDDDIAAPTLLEEHIKTHERYSDAHYAVLNYTTWAPGLEVTPLMHFITEVGCFLFSYPYIKHGDVLDYTNFWGGRSSCKRSFLIEHGVFNAIFRFGCEDIELGYRLSKHGLKVIYNSKAVSYMTRPVDFDDFCARLLKQGRSQYVFSSLHDDPAVHHWAEVVGWEEKWTKIKKFYEAKKNSAKGLDKIANTKLHLNLGLDDTTRKLLYNAYWWVFRACKLKGIAEARANLA